MRLVRRDVLPLAWSPDRRRLLIARGFLVEGETVLAIATVDPAGRQQRLLGVADEEDFNIGSYPAWQPVAGPLRAPVADPIAPRPEWSFCLQRLLELSRRAGPQG